MQTYQCRLSNIITKWFVREEKKPEYINITFRNSDKNAAAIFLI